jgi:peptide/nickel transport system ATP-binding protein
MPDVLAFERVAIDYESRGRRQRIVDDLSFAIGQGETLGLVGESGCGKSTVALASLRYLPRGMRVSSGRVLVEGRDLATMDDEAIRAVRGNRIAMVYQDPMSSLNPVMTIGRQLV